MGKRTAAEWKSELKELAACMALTLMVTLSLAATNFFQ